MTVFAFVAITSIFLNLGTTFFSSLAVLQLYSLFLLISPIQVSFFFFFQGSIWVRLCFGAPSGLSCQSVPTHKYIGSMSRDVLMTLGCLPEPQNSFALVVTDHLHSVSLLYVRHCRPLSYQSRTWHLFLGFFLSVAPSLPFTDASFWQFTS